MPSINLMNKKIQDKIQHLRKRQEEMEESIVDALQSQKVIFEACYQLIQSIYQLTQSIPEEEITISGKVVQLIAGDKETLKLNKTFGKIYNIPKIDLQKSQETMQTIAYKLLTLQNDEKLRGCKQNGVQKLKTIKLNKDEIITIKEVNAQVYNMAISNEGDVIISSKDCVLKQYTKDRNIKSYQSFSPLKTLGIHINKNNEIVVGLTESETFKDCDKTSELKVILLNQYEKERITDK